MTGELPARNGKRPGPQARRLSLGDAVRRRPFLAFGTPVVVIALTVLFVLWVPPMFETQAEIRIDQEQSGVGVLQTLTTLTRGSEVNTEMAVLRSRGLAEDVILSESYQLTLVEPERKIRATVLSAVSVDSLAPEATYTFERLAVGRYHVSAAVVHPGDPSRPFSRATTELQDLGEAVVGVPTSLQGHASVTIAPDAGDLERIVVHVSTFANAVESFLQSLVVSRPDREASVVQVTFRGGDPQLVQAVPNRLVSTFILQRQGNQSAEAKGTVQFLAEQLDTLQKRLGSSEERLQSFQESAGIVSLDDEASAQIKQLGEMKALRDIQDIQRSSLDSLMKEVRAEEALRRPGDVGPSPYRRLLAFPALLQVPLASQLLSQLSTLENQIAELRGTLTPQAPEILPLAGRIGELEQQIKSVTETYLASLNDQVSRADRQLVGFEGQLAGIPAAQMTFIRLRREAELLGELYRELQMRLQEARVVAAVDDQSVSVVDNAPYPWEPIRPKPGLSLFMALISGGVLGLAGALAAEHRDRSVRDRVDVGRVTGSAVLGLIPALRAPRLLGGNRLPAPWSTGRARPRLVQRVDAGDPAAEAYRALRTNLLFSRIDHPPRVLAFTSPMPGDGKSTTAMNLALVLAQQGHRVLLVDADMRRGLLNEVLQTAREPGLSEVLFGRVKLTDGVKSLEPLEGASLDFLPSGVWPPNPAELIASTRMSQLIAEAKASYETVIFDAPPLNLVTDAALLGTHCDGVVLVARAGVTEEASLEYAVEQLEKVRAPLLGTVLNGVESVRQDYYGSRGKRANAYFTTSR